MPLFGAAQTPTALSSGEKLAVLNAENLANNGLTMSVAFTPQPSGGPIPLSIWNNSAQSVTLEQSPDNTNWTTVMNEEGQPVVAQAGYTTVAMVAPAGYYRLANLSGTGITAGTIWLTR